MNESLRIIFVILLEHQSDTKVFTMMMEILREPTSNKLCASDEELEAPIKDQPLPADASPITLSPGYIADFNLEEDEEDPEEDPADHPVDGGENDDKESSDDDDDDDDVVKDTVAFEIDESASTPPISPYHIILFSKTKSHTVRMSI
ncbi:hypothetical protein Tco_1408698 [Tanacetum coccineum]